MDGALDGGHGAGDGRDPLDGLRERRFPGHGPLGGLVRDLARVGHVACDLLEARRELRDGAARLRDGGPQLEGLVRDLLDLLAHHLGALIHRADARGHLDDGGRGLLGARRLLGDRRAQFGAGAAELFGPRSDRLGGGAHPPDDGAQARDHVGDGDAELVALALGSEGSGEVPAAHALGGVGDLLEVMGHALEGSGHVPQLVLAGDLRALVQRAARDPVGGLGDALDVARDLAREEGSQDSPDQHHPCDGREVGQQGRQVDLLGPLGGVAHPLLVVGEQPVDVRLDARVNRQRLRFDVGDGR
ncbi:hypothetical protein D3C86_1282010 [compost metagenome]